MKLKRDHGYTQQKRIKHERAMNKYTGNLKENNTTTKFIERFSNDCRKTKTKAITPITTGADSATNQSQFLEITCNTLKAREKSRVHGAIAFGFASHWLKNWRESFKPITKRSNRNYIITFDSHLKTALINIIYYITKKLQINLILKVSSPQRESLIKGNMIF